MGASRARHVVWVLLAGAGTAQAMGLRSFVALPLERGGTATRVLLERDPRGGLTRATLDLAYGIDGRRTLFVSLPWQDAGTGARRAGGGLLARVVVRQADAGTDTRRLALLAGATAAPAGKAGSGLQAGAVATLRHGRREWDADVLLRRGFGDLRDGARYDLSWQYRLAPARYGRSLRETDAIVELNGRWTEGARTLNQVTLGLQEVRRRWALGAGLVRDLGAPRHTRAVLSLRWHF